MIMTTLNLPYATSALESERCSPRIRSEACHGDHSGMDAHTASLDAHMYCRYEGAPAGHIENGRWPGGASLSAVVVHSAHSRLGLDEGA